MPPRIASARLQLSTTATNADPDGHQTRPGWKHYRYRRSLPGSLVLKDLALKILRYALMRHLTCLAPSAVFHLEIVGLHKRLGRGSWKSLGSTVLQVRGIGRSFWNLSAIQVVQDIRTRQ